VTFCRIPGREESPRHPDIDPRQTPVTVRLATRDGGGVLPRVRTMGVFGDHGRTVCARQRPTQTLPNTLVRICKAGVESSILFVSTGPDLGPCGSMLQAKP
jgi:hypothetical protein